MKWKTLLLIVSGIGLLWMSTGAFADTYPIQTAPALDQSNNIRNYLMRVASDVTHHSLDGIETLDDWKKIRSQRYQQYLEMMSLTDVPLEGERPAA